MLRVSRGRPERAYLAPTTARLNRPGKHKHELVCRMSVGRDHGPLCEASLVNGAVRHGLRERQNLDAWKAVNREP